MMYLFILLLLLAPGIASAQGNLFEPVAGDKALQILGAMFGKLGVFGASSGDAFATVISVLNGAALSVGGLLVAYTIFSGTLGTAHDGEMLGKKFSSIWVPIRTALGTALVLPVLNGGYCVMQLLVGWLIVQGVGLADLSWSAYTASVSSGAASTGIQRPEAKNFAYTAFESFVCVEAMKKAVADPNVALLNAGSNFGVSTESGATATYYYLGDHAERNGFAKDSCGKIEVAKWQLPTMAAGGTGAIAGVLNAAESLSRAQAVTQEHQAQVGSLLSTLQAQAAQLVATRAPVNTAAIDAAIAQYEEAVKAKAAAVINGMDAFKEIKENASRDGFVMAGSWYMKLSANSDLINRSLANVPSATGPKGNVNATFADAYALYLRPLYETLEKAKATGTFGIGNEPGGTNTTWFQTFTDSIKGGFDIQILLKKAFTSGTNFVINDGENPVLAMKRLGNWLLGIAGAATGAAFLAMATLGNAPGVGLALASATLIIAPPLLIAGFILSYVLPMMPFFIWLGVILGWLSACVQALIAAPLWAVMHLHPHGDDVTGRGGNGYSLVLTLLLRPMLMVFGLIAALVVLDVFGNFYNRIFADVFLTSQQDSSFLIMIFGMLFSALIYAGGLWVIMKKTFSFMHEVPDEMLNWFGGGGPQLGSSAKEVGGTEAYAAAHTAAGTAQQVGNIGSSIRGNALSRQGNALTEAQKTQDRQMSNERQMYEIDKEFGAGTSDMFETMANDEGAGFSLQKDVAKLRDALGQVGGAGSIGGDTFTSRLKEHMRQYPDQPFESHVNSALNKGLKELYGTGAGQTAAIIGQDENGKPSYFTTEFKRAVSTYKAAAQSLSEQGMAPEQIADTLGAATREARKNYQEDKSSVANNGKKPLKEFLSDRLNSAVGRPPSND